MAIKCWQQLQLSSSRHSGWLYIIGCSVLLSTVSLTKNLVLQLVPLSSLSWSWITRDMDFTCPHDDTTSHFLIEVLLFPWNWKPASQTIFHLRWHQRRTQGVRPLYLYHVALYYLAPRHTTLRALFKNLRYLDLYKLSKEVPFPKSVTFPCPCNCTHILTVNYLNMLSYIQSSYVQGLYQQSILLGCLCLANYLYCF